MTIHKRVNYGKVANMVLRITAMNGGRLRLKDVVKVVCDQLGLGLNPSAVKVSLGAYCQTKMYDRIDHDSTGNTVVVRVVEDWVVYG